MSVNISSELMDYDVILASASPRRKELLSLMCENFRVIPSDCDEKYRRTLHRSLPLSIFQG